MSIKYDFCVSLFRGRKRKILILIIILILLINAFAYVSLELFKAMKRRRKELSLANEINMDSKSNMKVIVGRYVGGSTGAQLTDEDINTNFYAPIPEAGAEGRPVQMSQREMIRSKDLYSLNSYNILVGDKIPINRTLPDLRSYSCKAVLYNISQLPTASVVIVFHNEAWSTLMRTIMSVLNRSPDSLLKEIILVDDASERRYLGKELEDAIANLAKVQLLRNKKRSGIVGTRLMGARKATGDVLIFLDAHCEATPGWIEPLLERAGSDDVYICPHIDIISDETFAYSKSIDAHWGAFSWRLHFRWLIPSAMVLEARDLYPAKPYPTPAMAGGLFAVRRSLFWRLGGYDEGMKIWGGENLELSWRAWQCGARVEITPCSRVGHIFRQSTPYRYPGGVESVLYGNLARASTVWMDDWADFFFKFNPDAANLRDIQRVGHRVQLRKDLKCKSFEWYLSAVWPQHFFPTNERWFGRIKSFHGACIGMQQTGSRKLTGPARGIPCGDDTELNHLVVYTLDGQIMIDDGLCLEFMTEYGKGAAHWRNCAEKKDQLWMQDGPRLKNWRGECLALRPTNDKSGVNDPLKLLPCAPNEKSQIWDFERVPWK